MFSETKCDILACNSFSNVCSTLDLVYIKIDIIISSCTYSVKRHAHTVQNSTTEGNKVALLFHIVLGASLALLHVSQCEETAGNRSKILLK